MAEKNEHAVALGRRGGLARAARLTPAQRSEAGRKAVLARWSQTRDLQTVAQQHREADEACGRPWSCACALCRTAKKRVRT